MTMSNTSTLTYSACCPVQAIQVGPKGDPGVPGPPGPITTPALIAVGGVTGLDICGQPVLRDGSTGRLLWSPNGLNGIGCVAGNVGIIVDSGSPIPSTVGTNGLSVGPVDAMVTGQIVNFCAAVGNCRSGGLTGAGASVTAGPGLVAIGTTLTVGDFAGSPVPYSVNASGLSIGPVPAAQVTGFCAAVLACVQSDTATYQNLIVTTAAVCAAGAITSITSSDSIQATPSGCVTQVALRTNPASPLPISVTAAGIAVGLPTAAQLCSLGAVIGVSNSATLSLSTNAACVLSGSVNIPALVSTDAGNHVTLGADGKLSVQCSTVRTCVSGSGLISYNQATGVFSLTPGTNGQVLGTTGGAPAWVNLPAVTTLAAGCGITVTGGPAYTVAINRAALIGSGLTAGATTCDIALDPSSTTFRNGVCAYLGSLLANGNAVPGTTLLVGADCRTYTLAAQTFPALTSPNGSLSISGSTTAALTADINWTDPGNVAAVQNIACAHLSTRTDAGLATTGAAGTKLVGADCQLYEIPTPAVTAGAGIAAAGMNVSVNRPDLIGPGLMAGSGAVNLALDTASATFTTGVCSYLGSLTPNGLVTTGAAGTLLVGSDCRTYRIPSQVFATLADPSNSLTISGSGTAALSASIDWANAGNVTAVQNIACAHLATRPVAGLATTGAAGTLLVGADCQLYRIPTPAALVETANSAGCGILATGTLNRTIAVDRAALFGTSASTSLVAGPDTCSLMVSVDGIGIKRTALGALRVDLCAALVAAVAGAATANAATDKFLVVDSAGNCQVRTIAAAAETANVAGCGILATGTLNRNIAVDRAALFGTTTATSLEAGADTCSLRVKVDGTTMQRSATGALIANGCEIIKVAAAGAATAQAITDKMLVLDAAGNCQVRSMGLVSVEAFGFDAACASVSLGVDTAVTLKLRAGAGIQIVRNAAGDFTIQNTRTVNAAFVSIPSTATAILPAAGTNAVTVAVSGAVTAGVQLTDPAATTMLNPTCNPMRLLVLANTEMVALTGIFGIGPLIWVNGAASNSLFTAGISANYISGAIPGDNPHPTQNNAAFWTQQLPAGTSALVQVTRIGRSNNVSVAPALAGRTLTNTGGLALSSFVAMTWHV